MIKERTSSSQNFGVRVSVEWVGENLNVWNLLSFFV